MFAFSDEVDSKTLKLRSNNDMKIYKENAPDWRDANRHYKY